MVLGGPKYIPGYLRNISKKFSKNEKIFFTSKIFLGTSFRVAHEKKKQFLGLKSPKITLVAKKCDFSKFEISIP